MIGFQHSSAKYLMAFISLKLEEEGDKVAKFYIHVKIHLTISGFSVSVETLCHYKVLKNMLKKLVAANKA